VSSERTERATPQRRKKALKEGKVGRTPEFGVWLGMLAATLLVPMTLRMATARVKALALHIPGVIENPDPAKALSLLREGTVAALVSIAPLATGVTLIAVLASVAQGGIHPALGLLAPKFSRVNPLSGLKKVVGPHSVWELVKALVKTGALGAVMYVSVRHLVPLLMQAGSLPVTAILSAVGGTLLNLMRVAALAGLVMAGADYFVVYRRNQKQLKMTKQEVKDEYKRSEGDPHIKGQIRARQLAMSRNRMMTDLPKADVVIVNPTHVATALRYEPAKGAPRVIAKGAGTVAAKIREVATEHRIPMVQDIPLAHALYGSCEIGAEIPAELYGSVARVLAFIMGLKARGSAAGTHRPFPSQTAAA
jgi:flagellar biosynthesis protein FlhB